MSNNNNNNQTQKTDWKMYLSLVLYAILGIAIGFLVYKGVTYFNNKESNKDKKIMQHDKGDMVQSDLIAYVGNVSHNFEGTQSASITFKHDKNQTVEQGTDSKSKYFYIKNADGQTLATIYMSYEGGRGFSAVDYLSEVIAKAVPTVSAPITMNHASTTWMYAATANSEWHIMPSTDGAWLLIMENKKENGKSVTSVKETIVIK
jgi:hypothetical protein